MTLRRFAATSCAAVLCACGGLDDPARASAWDVRGNYALTYDDQLKLQLNLGGAVREATATGYGEVVDFGTHEGEPLKLDLKTFCAREDVQCPSEVLWKKVAIDQREHTRDRDVHVIDVIDDTEHDLPAGARAAAVAGLVDRSQQGKFLIGLGAEGGSNESCAALAVSLAGGRFSRTGETLETVTVHRDERGKLCGPDAPGADGGVDAGTSDAGVEDGGVSDGGTGVVICTPREEQRLRIPEGAPVGGIKEGKILVAWMGGCAFGPIVAGATLTIETGFTGTRTGEFDPPPFTPVEPVEPEQPEQADGGTEP